MKLPISGTSGLCTYLAMKCQTIAEVGTTNWNIVNGQDCQQIVQKNCWHGGGGCQKS